MKVPLFFASQNINIYRYLFLISKCHYIIWFWKKQIKNNCPYPKKTGAVVLALVTLSFFRSAHPYRVRWSARNARMFLNPRPITGATILLFSGRINTYIKGRRACAVRALSGQRRSHRHRYRWSSQRAGCLPRHTRWRRSAQSCPWLRPCLTC